VPEFNVSIPLEEGMRRVIAAMDENGKIPDSDRIGWEDEIIAAQRSVWKKKL
ncbi:hypothetical protein GX618_03810, partial [Candidatus Dojkabacteria bacterium]|nr:hypothetical protein [Candidatus Dojkabacteria bacterium]